MATLFVTILVLVLAVFPIWALVRILQLGRENNALAERLNELAAELRELKGPAGRPAEFVPAPVAPAPLVRAVPPEPVVVLAPEPPPVALPPAPDLRPEMPPPLPPVVAAEPPPLAPPAPVEPPPRVYEPAPLPAPEPTGPRLNWEQFMGAKLFAWLAGLAAFLGAAFFIKYSFEHDLIPPALRAMFGYVFALGLVGGGLWIPRARYAIAAQTLCATGVVCLYGVTYACNAIYHFAFFGPLETFGLMALVTAAAFGLAVRLDARVVAVLGMVGGFLTPFLLSTGQDNPFGLFSYIALLDAGLIAVALHRHWHFLVGLGAGGTVLMQLAWAFRFLNAGKATTAMVVCLGFCALFLAAHALARRLDRLSAQLRGSAVVFPVCAFGFALALMQYRTVCAEPARLFAFILAADLCLLALAWWDEALPRIHLVAGVAVFGLISLWTAERLTPGLLPWGLGAALLFAILHTAYPLLLERRWPAAAPTWWSQLFPPLSLLLLLGPILKLDQLTLAFWPCVLLVDLLAIGLALVTGSLAGVAVVLVLTLGVTAVWMLQLPATLDDVADQLLVIGGFAAVFVAAGIFLARRMAGLPSSEKSKGAAVFGDARMQLPAFAALLPFVLLVLMVQRLPLADPTPVFGLAALLVVLVLGLSAWWSIAWLPACALAGAAALQFAWRDAHFTVAQAPTALAWFLGFYAVFTVYPFWFGRRLAGLTGPWAVAALAGLVQFPLVHQTIRRAWATDYPGLVPALFALAPLVGLWVVQRDRERDASARLNQLAWFGGVTLAFVTLIFPIQFDRQWITLGWALEGAALLWLFHRVPHPALRATGVVLLAVAFARLALNPAVLSYHARQATAVFNWYLYTYGIVTAALFAGARLLAPPRERVLGLNAPALLGTLGTVLAFLLLNLEIADYFTPEGARVLTFKFRGSFARDMTYTIAWSLFALGLLLVSIWRKIRVGRFAALALLGVALFKLFFRDLAHLQALYRIGALFAVAVIAFAASLAYQRWLPADEKKDKSDETKT